VSEHSELQEPTASRGTLLVFRAWLGTSRL
jgi:hypothetical protein